MRGKHPKKPESLQPDRLIDFAERVITSALQSENQKLVYTSIWGAGWALHNKDGQHTGDPGHRVADVGMGLLLQEVGDGGSLFRDLLDIATDATGLYYIGRGITGDYTTAGAWDDAKESIGDMVNIDDPGGITPPGLPPISTWPGITITEPEEEKEEEPPTKGELDP